MNTKRMALWGILLLLCLTPLVLTSCAHRHVEGPWQIEVEATCTQTGIHFRCCSDCGEELERESYTQEHSYEDSVCVNCGRARYGGQYLKFEEITVDGKAGYTVAGMGNCSAKELEIPEKHNNKPVLAIKDEAFLENPRLESVVISKNIVTIGTKAFFDCTLLKTVIFANKTACTSIGESAFGNCTALTSFTFPEGVTTIPRSMFIGCEKLKTVALHDGIISVGDDAFEGCEKLTTKEQNGVQYLGTEENPHLLAVSIADKNTRTLTLAAGTRLIYSYAFAGCDKLTTVMLPESVTVIGGYAFAGCESLTELTLSETLVTVGTHAFSGCVSLAAVTLPAVTSIGSGAFRDCTALTLIVLSAKLETVGVSAFHNCTALQYTAHGNGLYLGNEKNPYLLLAGLTDSETETVIHESNMIVADGVFSGRNALA